MAYRIKQFIWAITAKLSEVEYLFVKEYLSVEEEHIFSQLKVYEQKHCIKVAKALEQAYKGVDQTEVIRLGLLHDIGKIKDAIGPIRKSIMVLLDKFTKGKISNWTFLRMVRCYYHHPQQGYELLKQMGGYSDSFLNMVKEHHIKVSEANDYAQTLKLLKEWDNKA